MTSAELILRMTGVTMLAFFAVVWWRDLRGHPAGPLVALYCFGVASYLLCPPLHRHWQLGIAEVPIFFGCYGAAVFFWLMSRALFDDSFALRPWHGGLLLLAEALGGGRWLVLAGGVPTDAGPALADLLQIGHKLLSLTLVVSALVLAYRGRAGDLVEPRRRFRGLFVGISGVYILVVAVSEIYFRTQAAPMALEMVNLGMIFLLVFAFSLTLVQLRPGLLPVVAGIPPPPATSPETPPAEADAPLLAALRRRMDEEAAYRQDSLTIGRLAEDLGTQEYRLRRLINGALGYRNFNAFLNDYRINEARRRLADPADARLPILTIAMDCGFASLGPFNRAFKQATGMTPSDFRRQAQPDPPAET